MPNWCINDLRISGPTDELKRFKAFAESKAIDTGREEDKCLDFNNFDPYPEEFKKKDSNGSWGGFNGGGYEWCCNHWGCKWNSCSDCIVEDIENNLHYALDTAWSPPRAIVRKMGSMFPLLRFELTFFEPGCGFKGQMIVDKDNLEEDETEDFVPCEECGWDPSECDCKLQKKLEGDKNATIQ
jgi:hypothetical protein